MQRYFVTKDQLDVAKGRASITGDDVNHITRVLRMGPNDRVIVSDGEGTSCIIELDLFTETKIEGRIIQTLEDQEPKVKITLVQGLPKGDKMDLITQKCTEIGIASIVPVDTTRSIVKYDEKKRMKVYERWSRIAKEAAEQAQRGTIPTVVPPMPLRQWLQIREPFDLLLVPYESETRLSIKHVLRANPAARRICVAIGPEGGWDEQEIQLFAQHNGIMVTLGPRILRTETAGLVAATAILYEMDEMGGVQG
jgi:16S rRNA (uracil1498-N3)-methyltransferase